MYLFIDSTNPEKLVLELKKAEKRVSRSEVSVKYNLSELILPAIDRLLKKKKLKVSDLTGIAVVSGLGPFSATRTGVATANALGFSLNIPVVGLKNGRKYKKNIKLPKKWSVKQQARPEYFKPPNITRPK